MQMSTDPLSSFAHRINSYRTLWGDHESPAVIAFAYCFTAVMTFEGTVVTDIIVDRFLAVCGYFYVVLWR